MEFVPDRISFPETEEAVLAYWDRVDALAKALEWNKGSGDEFVFYDGPPFATGTPHYGHILAGTIKDAVTRYWVMNGKVCCFRKSTKHNKRKDQKLIIQQKNKKND
jgi:isoleucyl-tRNA synthetase